MDYTETPGSANEHGNHQYHGAQIQTAQAFSGFDTATINPNLLHRDQNTFDQPTPRPTFTQTPDVHESWGGTANSQVGPRRSMGQPSVNTAPPFASRQTTIPRREYHSENSASIRARFDNQFDTFGCSDLSATPSTSSRQIPPMASSTFQSNPPSQSVQIDPYFPLNSTCHSLNEHPQTPGLSVTTSISQVQSPTESFDSLSRKRMRAEDYYGGSDVETNNDFARVQTQSDASLLEQSRIGLIKHWLDAFPKASIFDPKNMEALATLMNVPIETVQQLFMKILRTQSENRSYSVGSARFPFEASNPPSASLLERYVSQDTSSASAFAAVVQWVERRGPQCKPTSNHDRLVRRGNRIYQCTRACGSAFVRKEDWARHELCSNYPQEGWICNWPSTVSVEGVLTCSICGVQNPDIEHSHSPHNACQNKRTFKGRVFFREDHFIQHFDNVHRDVPVREHIARAHFHINSKFPRQCGFCNESEFQSWQHRVDHLAVHFKEEGKDMKDWRVAQTEGLCNVNDDDDDDNDDDDEEDDERRDNQDDNDKNGSRKGNFQSYGGSSKRYLGHSGSGSSRTSGTSGSGANLPVNSYQYTAELNGFRDQRSINFQGRGVGKNLAPASNKIRPESPLSHPLAPSTVFPQCSVIKSDTHPFHDPPPSASQLILLVNEAVDSIVGAKAQAEFASEDSESNFIETYCKKPTNYHSTGKIRTVEMKEIFTLKRKINNLHWEPIATTQRDMPSNATLSTISDRSEMSFSAASVLASSLTLQLSYLEQRLLDAQIPWGTHLFIPTDAIERIVTKRAIYEELNRVTNLSASNNSVLSHKIWENARKIFAILVCIGKGKLIPSFLSEGITDTDLPFNIPKGSLQQKKWITTIKTFKGCSPRELDDFSRVQWYFLAPIFTKIRNQHYELDDNCVMPFIKDTEHEAQSGGFSDVWEVVIHPAHQKFFDSNENQSIALKRLHSRNEDDFKHEAYMLRALAQNDHHHLVKLLATYKFRGQYHFMFPYANSNLRQYWEQNEPCWSREALDWMLKQMHGLASALHAIHNFSSATPNNQSPHKNSQQDSFLNVKSTMKFEEEIFGRHGDLKPENILWFESVPGSPGTLQIADLGLGTFHTLESRSNVEVKNVGGSPTYVPPECALGLPISRAYDIWSLGCVYLEFVIWLMEGPEGLEKFANDRLRKAYNGVYDNSFFVASLNSDTSKRGANVCPAVLEWVRDLRTHQRSSAIIYDLLNLIEQEMLVIRPQNRITSERLSQKLNDFAIMAATNESYIFQELIMAKHKNEIFCETIPRLFDLFWSIEKITGMPINKKLSSNVPDLSAQLPAAYVATKSARLCFKANATWSLSRELDEDLAQSSRLEMEQVPDLNDPILEHFALRRLSTASAASHIEQIARPSSRSLSIDRTELDETSSNGTDSEFGWTLGSPATSQNSDSTLIGLELPDEYRDKPFFCDVNDENDANIYANLSQTLYGHTSLQARANALPWTPDVEDSLWPNSDELALAPSPGPVYNEYYSSIRNYTRNYQEIRRERRTVIESYNTQSTTFESFDETVIRAQHYQRSISPNVSSQCLSASTETRGKSSHDHLDEHAKRLSDTFQQPKIPCSVDCTAYSLETLVSIFHPSFLVSHLSRSSVSALTTEIYAPEGLIYETEHTIDFSLGFGPAITLSVCTFTPRNKRAMYSYQIRQGQDKIRVQESLPIFVNLFSIESHAEDLDAWLGRIIDSEFELSEYVNLIMRRQKDDYSSQVLKVLVYWYTTSKDKLPTPGHQLLRAALKLLITSTLLSLVPKVTDLTESLSNSLHYSKSPAQAIIDISTRAPRLLTRQIKASIYYLQQQFLYTLFCHFTYTTQLNADVKIATALLVAIVLDLWRNAGREFAKYSQEWDPTHVVNEQEVTRYESNVQSLLFDRVRASFLDTSGKMSELVESLRNIGSIVKWNRGESGENQFVSAILQTVL